METVAMQTLCGTAAAPLRASRCAVAPLRAAPRRRHVRHLAAHASTRSPVAAAAAAPKRAFNFSAGPACLPLDVLQTAQAELVDWHGSGMSVLEMSHRGPEFESIIAKAEKDLRTLMKIPDNYKARARGAARSRSLTLARSRLCAQAKRTLATPAHSAHTFRAAPAAWLLCCAARTLRGHKGARRTSQNALAWA
jgi:phosphoserine aminotransferase